VIEGRKLRFCLRLEKPFGRGTTRVSIVSPLARPPYPMPPYLYGTGPLIFYGIPTMPTTDGNPNVNCLQGMRCPSCGDFGPFSIQVTQRGMVRVSDNGTDFIDGNVEWEDESECECLACRHTATVAEFRGEPKPAFDAHQTFVLNTYVNGEFAHIIPGQE
jgi:hypothetical protein